MRFVLKLLLVLLLVGGGYVYVYKQGKMPDALVPDAVVQMEMKQYQSRLNTLRDEVAELRGELLRLQQKEAEQKAKAAQQASESAQSGEMGKLLSGVKMEVVMEPVAAQLAKGTGGNADSRQRELMLEIQQRRQESEALFNKLVAAQKKLMQ